MNILIVFLGKNGGLPKFTFEFVNGLIENGYNVYCVFSSKIRNKELWDLENRIKKISYIYTGSIKTYILTCLYMLTVNRLKLLTDFKGVAFDLSICTMPYPWCLYIMKMLASKNKAVICHDPIAHEGTSFFMKKIQKIVTRGYDNVIIMSEKFRNILKDNYGYSDRQITYMRHGTYGYVQNVEKCPYDISEEKIHFLFFGRISKYKGIEVLVQAYKKVKEQYNNCDLTIAGSGNLSPYISENDIMNDIKIINRFIPDEEVPLLYEKAYTITVLPYTGATQSGVIPVAMQFGSPIIATDVGGLREQLFDGKIGLIVKPNDPDDLAEKMSWFLSNEELYVAQSREIIKFYPKLRWDSILKETVSKLVEVSKGNNNSDKDKK